MELPLLTPVTERASLANPFSTTKFAALPTSSDGGPTGNNLTSTPAAASSGHRGLAKAAEIVGIAFAGVGATSYILAATHCHGSGGVCGPMETAGEIMMPAGAVSAVLGFVYRAHHPGN
jgi:hypothetical protein